MSIKSILSQKSQNLISCKKEDTILECVKSMNENKIGALIVLTVKGKINGIITERDILHAIHKNKGNIGKLFVKDIMTPKTKLIVASGSESTEKLMDMMTNNRIRHIPIVENDEIIGLISIGDLVKEGLSQCQVENESMKNYIVGNS